MFLFVRGLFGGLFLLLLFLMKISYAFLPGLLIREGGEGEK